MDRNKKIIKISIQGIIVNVFLVIFKSIVGGLANSIAIILDAVNNFSDALSAIITIIGTKLAGKKPDKEHPFGHGRIEYLASIVIGIIILLAGISAFKESFHKILHPEQANYSIASIIIVVVAIFVKFFFGKYVKREGKKINSQSLIATGTDALMDSVISLSTLIAVVINIVFKIRPEGYIGVFISLFIIKSSIDILKDTIEILIGRREDIELINKIKNRINQIEEVQGTYDLTLHNYGPSEIIGSVHIQVEDEMTAREIHKLSKKIQAIIYSEFGIILSVGIYASNTNSREFVKIKEELKKIIEKYDNIMQLHGFYVDEETKTISFDLIIDFKEKEPENIRDLVVKEIKEKYPDYNYYVILDKDYSE